MQFPEKIKDMTKIIGYFAYTNSGSVFCDGDACIIADTEENLKDYIDRANFADGEGNIIKKTRFGEIITGIKKGGAYAFDKGAYIRFTECTKNNGIDNIPSSTEFPESENGMAFIKIQVK